jgi:hypothetical protein
VNALGQPADPGNCGAGGGNASAAGLAREPCNPSPCSRPYWSVGPWGACSAPCVDGVASASWVVPTTVRSVACVDPAAANSGAPADPSLCGGETTRPHAARECNTQLCPRLATNATALLPDASSSSCTGVLDPAGACCPSPAPSGFCCLANTTSSSSPSSSTAVDDCGVCSGVNSCPVVDAVTLVSPALAARLCDGPSSSTTANRTRRAGVGADLAAALSRALLPPVATAGSPSLAVTDVQCVRTAARLELVVSYTLTRPNAATAVVAAAVTDRLAAAAAALSATALTVVSTNPVRVGECGNAVCEIGETADTCAQDCALAPLACPASAAGATCAGHGACRLAEGTCACNDGWGGASCDACAVGYTARALSQSAQEQAQELLDCLPLTDSAVLADIANTTGGKEKMAAMAREAQGAAAATGAGGSSSSSSSSFTSTGGFTGLVAVVASLVVAVAAVLTTLSVVRSRQRWEDALRERKRRIARAGKTAEPAAASPDAVDFDLDDDAGSREEGEGDEGEGAAAAAAGTDLGASIVGDLPRLLKADPKNVSGSNTAAAAKKLVAGPGSRASRTASRTEKGQGYSRVEEDEGNGDADGEGEGPIGRARRRPGAGAGQDSRGTPR